MKIWRIVSLGILSVAVLNIAGCVSGLINEDQKAINEAIDEAKIVFCYFEEPDDGSVWLSAGPYQDGTAVIGPPNDRAFWIINGTAFTVNQAARDAAPELDQAPDRVKYDDAFIEAADFF